MNTKIPLSSSHLTGEELEFINDSLIKNELGTSGANITVLEEELKALTGAPHAILLNNGTSAIHMALVLLGVKNNDEIICPTFAPMSTINPVIYQGAKPLFVDCEEDTWCMSPVLLECAIKDRLEIGRRPKAIIVTHVYGNPAKMSEIMETSVKYNIPVIEDATTALGSLYKDKYAGTYGTFGAYSFAANNIITAGSGGALVSENKMLIDKARELNEQHFHVQTNYHQYQTGYNYLMNNICAGIGRAQIKVIEERVRQRRENFIYYVVEMSGINGVKFQSELFESRSNCCLTGISINSNKFNNITAEMVRKALTAANIENYPLYKPMHLQPMFKDATYYGNWTSDLLYSKGICLPSGSNLTKADLDRIIEVIRTVLGQEPLKKDKEQETGNKGNKIQNQLITHNS